MQTVALGHSQGLQKGLSFPIDKNACWLRQADFMGE
jgi:hypothetical protein